MAGQTQNPKRDAERARKVLDIERKNYPTYKQPSPIGSYLLLILALAVVGVIVYSIVNRKGQISRLWDRAMHPGTVPAQVQPGQ